VIAIAVSFLYTTGFWYTDRIAVFSAIFICMAAMTAPVVLKASGRPSYRLAGVSLATAVVLFVYMVVFQSLFHMSLSMVESVSTTSGVALALWVIFILFAGVFVVGILVPGR
jgi:hypothetical protein